MSVALVSGATGLLGSHIVSRLLADGWTVRALSRSPELARLELPAAVEIHTGDVLDEGSFERAAKGCHVVFHAAANVLTRGGWEAYRVTNVDGTRNAIAAAASARARLLHVSSVSVYGQSARYEMARLGKRTDEETPLAPLSERAYYARSKRDSEALVLRAHLEGRVWATAVRPDVVYGPGDRHFVPRMARLITRFAVPLLRGGRATMAIVQAENVASGAVLAATSDVAGGKVYNLANDFDVSVRRFFELRGRRSRAPAGVHPITDVGSSKRTTNGEVDCASPERRKVQHGEHRRDRLHQRRQSVFLGPRQGRTGLVPLRAPRGRDPRRVSMVARKRKGATVVAPPASRLAIGLRPLGLGSFRRIRGLDAVGPSHAVGPNAVLDGHRIDGHRRRSQRWCRRISGGRFSLGASSDRENRDDESKTLHKDLLCYSCWKPSRTCSRAGRRALQNQGRKLRLDRESQHTPMTASTVVKGACPHDCPDTCAMLITVEDGRAVRVAGDPDHPFTNGFLCAKVNRYIERTYHRDRVLYPMRRTGRKGSGEFERVSWEIALDEIGRRLTEIVGSPDGAQSILPYSYAGTMGLLQGSSIDRRFFHSLGASKLDRTICSTPGAVGMRMTLGASIGADVEGLPESDLVLLWGTNTLTSNPHMWPFVLRARERGAKVIAIDPIRTRTAAQCDEWLGIRPGTDAALALGIMHVVFERGLEDRDYLARHTLGETALRTRAREYTPTRVAEITGLPADTVVSLGERYGRSRAAFIRVNYGLQRHAGGGMAVRTIACLPAIVGHWRHAGGGVNLSTSNNFAFDKQTLERPDLSPPVRTINMIRLGEALTTRDAGVGGPPVRALVVYNSNPAAVAPDRNAVTRGLAREDLFTVVLEHFLTDTADWADFVLPATTQLEHWDIHLSYGHHYVTLNRPSIEPVGEAKPNTEIFRLLAARMGLSDPIFTDDDLTLVRQSLNSTSDKFRGVTLDALMERGWVRLNVPTPYLPFANGEFPTPSGKCEFYSERLKEMGLDPVPTYIAPYESPERDPLLVKRFPLTLISSPAHQFLNSTFVNVDSLRRSAREPECIIHPADAERRGIGIGMRVAIHNDRGAFTAVARVDTGIREGVVWAPSIWWGKLTKDGANANQTTSQRETDMGHGPVFYDNQVEVSLAD